MMEIWSPKSNRKGSGLVIYWCISRFQGTNWRADRHGFMWNSLSEPEEDLIVHIKWFISPLIPFI